MIEEAGKWVDKQQVDIKTDEKEVGLKFGIQARKYLHLYLIEERS